MNHYRVWIACCIAATGGVALIAHQLSARSFVATPALAPFEFHRAPADRPQDAATALFKGISRESPQHFVKHLLLGVCDGSVDTLQKFAEAIHTTKFSGEDGDFNFYDLRDRHRGMNSKRPVRIAALAPFDAQQQAVKALQGEAVSTYYAESFVCVDVESETYDGLVYRSRIVVAQVDGGWFGIPRCRSATNFYKIADAMDLDDSATTDTNF